MPPKRSFRDAWLEDENFRQWLTKVEGNPHKAFCCICNSELIADVTSLKRHKSTKIHSDNMLHINTSNLDVSVPSTSNQDLVTRAEIKLASFFAEHNIALNAADHLIDLLKDILREPNVIQNITLKRSKATSVINKIGKVARDNIAETLRYSKFSIIIDETTDISTKKTCAVVVKYYDEKAATIQTRFLELLEIFDDISSEGSTGQHLFDILQKLFNDNNIPL